MKRIVMYHVDGHGNIAPIEVQSDDSTIGRRLEMGWVLKKEDIKEQADLVRQEFLVKEQERIAGETEELTAIRTRFDKALDAVVSLLEVEQNIKWREDIGYVSLGTSGLEALAKEASELQYLNKAFDESYNEVFAGGE